MDTLSLDRRLFREMVESVSESVVVLDGRGKIRYVNYVEEGFTLKQVIGRDASDFIHPDYQAQHRNQLQRILKRGGTETFEVPGHGPPAERQWYAGQARPIVRNGEPVGIIVVMKNVTELRRVRRQAGHLKRLLPICPWCGEKVQVNSDHWVSLEEYLYESGDFAVSHGMCPDCGADMVEKS